MTPERAAQLLFRLGLALLLAGLGLRALSLGLNYQEMRQPDVVVSDLGAPFLGSYSLSPDGRQISLEARLFNNGQPTGGAFVFDRVTGQLTPGVLPDPVYHFVFQDGRLHARIDNQIAEEPLTPAGMIVGAAGYSPDGRRMAFVNRVRPGQMRLYVLSATTPARLLLEGPFFTGLTWSPVVAPASAAGGSDNDQLAGDLLAGSQLAYLAPVDGIDQLFRCVINSPCPQQLTFDRTRKVSPAWSPDGRWIAYLSFRLNENEAAPGLTRLLPSAQLAGPEQSDGAVAQGFGSPRDVYVVDSSGGSPRRITPEGEQPFNLSWGGLAPPAPSQPSPDAWITYSKWQEQVTYPFSIAWLYGYRTNETLPAEASAPLRIFPPAAIDQLDCSANPGGAGSGRFGIRISNTGLGTLPVRVIARSAGRPITGLDPKAGQVRAETITLAAGETRRLDWDIPLPDRTVSYVSVLVDQGGPFPFSEASCRVVRRWLGVPRLRWLPASLSLAMFSTLLALPGLRRRPWVRLLWGAGLILFAASLIIESLFLTLF